MSAFGSPAGQYQASALRCHTSPESELSVSLDFAGLVGSFSFVTHEIFSNFTSLNADIFYFDGVRSSEWCSIMSNCRYVK